MGEEVVTLRNGGNHGKPCQPGCQCGRHNRTKEHNYLIGRGVSATYWAKKRAVQSHV